MKKRIFAIVLCLVVAFTSVSFAFAAEGVTGNSAETKITEIENDSLAGTYAWVKNGIELYKNYADANEKPYLTKSAHYIKVKSVFETEDGTKWYEIEIKDLSVFWLYEYKYVKADGVSKEEPEDDTEFPDDPEEPDDPIEQTSKGTSVGETQITITGGIPASVKLTAKEVAKADYNKNVYEKIHENAEIAFAFDITPKYSNETKWQSENEKTITVDIDVTEFGFSDGDIINIIHELEDGKLEKVSACTVENGEISFDTGSFSVFYGYTVDFEFDGTWHSIAGGSDIYLYELFAQLGIENSTLDIESIDFTDDTLIEVTQREIDVHTQRTDWYLKSLKPFNTEEVLTIKMKDDSEIIIKVYDAQYTALSNDLTLNEGDVINGASVSGNVNVKLNGTVTITNMISVQKGASLTITGAGTLKRDPSFTGRMFSVTGGKLDISGRDIVIDGGAVWSSSEVEGTTREKINVTSGGEVQSAAIYVDNKNQTVNSEVILTEITMKNLYTASGGQAPAIHTTGDGDKTGVDAYHSVVTMTDVTIKDCATMSGQAITLFNDCAATLNKCKYIDNFSGGTYAGAIKAGGSTYFGQLDMINCEATGNYSSGWGGVVLWAANNQAGSKESKATIDGCTFDNNKARYLGGALSNEAIMEVKNTSIKNNIAMAGGGIATFPFTLTETHDGEGHDNACGLILSGGNFIEANTAMATGDFTPFMYQDVDVNGTVTRNEEVVKSYNSDATIADDTAIPTPITYFGGGGGIWCYMNKPDWECSLEIGNGNIIKGNTAVNRGGGVYMHHVSGTVSELMISGAEIASNTAKNGGGVALNDANLIINNGAINYNTAVNGGGVYVTNGGTIEMQGGSEGKSAFIVGNTAKIPEDENNSGITTAYTRNAEEVKGIGGGIYIEGATDKKSVFKLTGTKVGIYDNLADFAADDVFANGLNTELNVPDVKTMTLEGLEIKPNGWFEDYVEGDSKYINGLNGNSDVGGKRYKTAGIEDTVEVVNVENANQPNKYVCMTLGIGRGTVIIDKVAKEGTVIDPDQFFTFKVERVVEGEGLEPISMIVTVQGDGERVINHLPYGDYVVTELTDWSWRYKFESLSYENSSNKATIDKDDDESVVTVVNSLEENKWLTDQFEVNNIRGNERVGE